MVAKLCHAETLLWVPKSIDDISSIAYSDIIGRGRCGGVLGGGDHVSRICGDDGKAGDMSFGEEAPGEDLLTSPGGGEPACLFKG